jgi:ferredoxin-thioredoxin reductase catalytic subunit
MIDQKKSEMLKEQSSQYAKSKGFSLNPNTDIVNTIITGLLNNESKGGFRYCPCRPVTGDKEQDKKIICPCAYHLKELETQGHCLCQLFVKIK